MPDVRRVSVYADDAAVDVALPSAVPIGSLIPAIRDIVDGLAARPSRGGPPVRYWLAGPGRAALDGSKTLAQQGIRDGTVLALVASPPPPPMPRYDDAAEAVSVSLAARPRPKTPPAGPLAGALAAGWLGAVGVLVLLRTAFLADESGQIGATVGVLAVTGCVALSAGAIAHRGFGDAIAGLTLGVLATGFAATAGLLTVPGGPGAPNALLAATAAAAMAVLALWLIGCGTATFTAIACAAILAAVAALVAVVSAAPLRAIGATCAVVSLALIEVSARMSIRLAGLAPQLAVQADADRSAPASAGLPAKAARADTWLTGLVGALSVSAALGASGTLLAVCSIGGSPAVAVLFATITGAALLVRSRSHAQRARSVILTVTGTFTLSVGFAVAATAGSSRLAWVAVAIAALTAGALSVGFVPPARRWSPMARRSAELAEGVALAAMVPLACWLGGLYGVARGLSLS